MNFSGKKSMLIKIIFGLIIVIGVYSYFKQPVVEGLEGQYLAQVYRIINNQPTTTYDNKIIQLKAIFDTPAVKNDGSYFTKRIKEILAQPDNKLDAVYAMIEHIKNETIINDVI
jgi:hypothetical protein